MRNASELFHRVFVRPFIANVSKSTHTHTYTHSRCWTSTVWFIGERLSPNIRNHFIYFEFEFVLTVSIGCSQPASHGNDSDSVWSHDIVNGSRVKYLYVGMCYHLSIAWHETQIRTGNPLRVCVFICVHISKSELFDSFNCVLRKSDRVMFNRKTKTEHDPHSPIDRIRLANCVHFFLSCAQCTCHQWCWIIGEINTHTCTCTHTHTDRQT